MLYNVCIGANGINEITCVTVIPKTAIAYDSINAAIKYILVLLLGLKNHRNKKAAAE